MRIHRTLPFLAIVLIAAASLAIAQQVQQIRDSGSTTQRRSNNIAAGAADTSHMSVSHVFRSSKLIGMDVKNPSGENLGEINELVIDVNTGRISYAALSFGGILGLGDKLFAVPWEQLKLKQDQNGSHFVLNLAKDKLENAPGFDKNNWPDVADANWSETVNTYYREHGSKDRNVSSAPTSDIAP
jgi:sporulation protein YlmC with PRC-barrel domain